MKRFIHILFFVVLLVTSCSTTDNDMYDKYYQQGLEALEAGNNEQAIASFVAAGRCQSSDSHGNMLMYGCLIVLFFVIYALHLTNKRLAVSTQQKVLMQIEKEKVEKLYADALVEKDTLDKMVLSNAPDDEMKSVIKHRLALLNKVITSYITDSSSANKEANAQIEMLVSNREAFLESTRKSFEAGHPKFMAYLRSKGLTDWEVNYCCLYLVGLNGKEIGEYINLKRHYTYGSVIRHKLGLGEHDKNLANHLKNLIENPPALNSGL